MGSRRKIRLKQFRCKQCGGKWFPRTPNPSVCPKCKSTHWNKKVKPNNYGRPRKNKPDNAIMEVTE